MIISKNLPFCVFFFACVIACSSDDQQLAVVPEGSATALLNGEPWSAAVSVYPSSTLGNFEPDYIEFRVTNSSGFLREHLSFETLLDTLSDVATQGLSSTFTFLRERQNYHDTAYSYFFFAQQEGNVGDGLYYIDATSPNNQVTFKRDGDNPNTYDMEWQCTLKLVSGDSLRLLAAGKPRYINLTEGRARFSLD